MTSTAPDQGNPFNNERVKLLTKESAVSSSHLPRLRTIIALLAFHLLHIQTALQMLWGMNGVDMGRETIPA